MLDVLPELKKAVSLSGTTLRPEVVENGTHTVIGGVTKRTRTKIGGVWVRGVIFFF